MGRYVLAAWTPWTDRPAIIDAYEAAAAADGWRTAFDAPGLWGATAGPRPPAMRLVPPGRILLCGDLYAHGPGSPGPARGDPAVAHARWLVDHHWGRYVALLRTPSGAPEGILRDPSGAREALTWTTDGLTLVASDLPAWLLDTAGPPLRLDWDAVESLLAEPTTITGPSALAGLRAVAPGDLHALDQEDAPHPLWRPAEIARQGTTLDAEQARDALRTVLDQCLSTLRAEPATWLAEVSGGLDSAIVAAAAAAAGLKPMRAWFNLYGPERSADERTYARALAERWQAPLHCEPRARRPVDLEALGRWSLGARPAVNVLDVAYDEALAERCRALSVDAVLTGKGGDAVLFEAPEAGVFVDHWRAVGWRALTGSFLPDIARWTRRSVWSVLGQILVAERPASGGSALLPDRSRDRPKPPAHPWLRDLRGLGPAKRFQIQALTAALGVHGRSRRSEAADQIHPLLSQPVVFLCLSLPTPLLTGGRRGRDLARAAFADRLPSTIRDRRSKGDLTAVFGHMIGESLPSLRAHLLDGRLMARGVLDRARAEAALDLDRLAWQGGYGDILTAAAVESWVRAWEARLRSGSPT